MALEPGTKLGTYEILSLIGVGGMGEVYRARDTKLGREVAIKVLPAAVAKDSERIARFQREARLLASLNHPNIATLHGLEESDDIHFLVMELIEGQTLTARLADGTLSFEEAFPLFQQIAEAVESAHEKGVVHRDLKPSNIMITKEGKPKVLDFGLAKAFGPRFSEGATSESPTLTRAGTETGVILGTAAYMSPEQARGRDLDKRTDIWSFGCIVYELLTGKAAFLGDTVSDTIAAILEREPDWQALPQRTPEGMRVLLRRCLQKNARHRLHDMADARIELEDARQSEEPGDLRGPGHRQKTLLPWIVAGMMAILAGIAGLYPRRTAPTSKGLVRASLSLPAGHAQPRRGRTLALSPDGNLLVYRAPDARQL
ncbi:MAG: serine/threonine protein kinase, partial [Acidobacteria bacterium]